MMEGISQQLLNAIAKSMASLAGTRKLVFYGGFFEIYKRGL